MSGEGRERGGVEPAPPRWDLLADYASGALDGTPEADRVADRIAADPEWARAHRELADADARMRDELSGLAGLTAGEAVPADLFERLDAALAAPSDQDDGKVAVVRSLAEARRRRYRMLSAAAAVVVVLAGVGGLIGLVGLGNGPTRTSSTVSGGGAHRPSSSEPAMGPHVDSKEAPSATGQSMAGAAARAPALEATGTDYHPATLATVLRNAPTSEALPQQPDGAPTLPSGSAARVPDGLSRLTGAGALDACLNALDGEFAARPVLVDYARFQGSAALVAVVPTAAADRPWLVVAGPECGTGTADVRYQRQAS